MIRLIAMKGEKKNVTVIIFDDESKGVWEHFIIFARPVVVYTTGYVYAVWYISKS